MILFLFSIINMKKLFSIVSPPTWSSQWSLDNRVQLNSEKCNELRISFTKKQSEFHPILVNGNQLEVVRSAKLLGVIITSDLSWNQQINETVKKASRRLNLLVQLKRAKLPCKDLLLFYATCTGCSKVRSDCKLYFAQSL